MLRLAQKLAWENFQFDGFLIDSLVLRKDMAMFRNVNNYQRRKLQIKTFLKLCRGKTSAHSLPLLP